MSAASVWEALAAHARADPAAPFLRRPDGRWLTRGEGATLALRLAARLAEAGARPGDIVALAVAKSPEAFLLGPACWAAGLTLLPTNPDYTAGELAPVLGDARPRLVVCDPARVEEAGVHGATVLTLDAAGAGTLTEALPEPGEPVAADAEAAGAILYTSGTTGRPKGAPLSVAGLLANAEVLARAWRFSARDRLLHMLPIFHAHGLFVAGNTAFVGGAATLFEPAFHPDRFFALLGEATVFMAVPTHYGRLLADPRLTREACAHMRLFTSGSAPLSAAAFEAFRARTGHAVLERYGMSETLMLTSNPYEGERRAGTVGPPLPGVEVRIRLPDGRPAAPGEAGSVEVRGPSVFRGYLNAPDKTAAAFTPDGWFITGDIGWFSADGYLTLEGRADDTIITGGMNVYPREVEDALLAQPDIAEAVVFGLPHPDLGQAVTAAVAPRPGAAPAEPDIIAAVRTRLAGYKTPKRVLVLPALPRNAMGKVDRKALRTAHRDLYAAAG
ncbi:MAG: AMP-binding protein [Sphingomonadaceae bacterium]